VAQFDKPALTVSQQVDLLKRRGLIIEDRREAERALYNISYYRLRGYTWPFQDNSGTDHLFLYDVTFSDIMSRYEFDRNLRTLVFDAL
jgi:abortive infection bacteriophage resistance protein